MQPKQVEYTPKHLSIVLSILALLALMALWRPEISNVNRFLVVTLHGKVLISSIACSQG